MHAIGGNPGRSASCRRPPRKFQRCRARIRLHLVAVRQLAIELQCCRPGTRAERQATTCPLENESGPGRFSQACLLDRQSVRSGLRATHRRLVPAVAHRLLTGYAGGRQIGARGHTRFGRASSCYGTAKSRLSLIRSAIIADASAGPAPGNVGTNRHSGDSDCAALGPPGAVRRARPAAVRPNIRYDGQFTFVRLNY